MRLLTLITAVLIPAALVAAPIPKDKEKPKDAELILGTWKPEAFDLGGAPGAPPQEVLEKIRFIFEKDAKFKIAGGPEGEELAGTFKLDAAAKPKTVDLTMQRPGSDQPETMVGLYELDGDTLKLCVPNGPGEARPTEFKPDGKQYAVITFKRVKEEKKDK
ncbi:MAG: TIGR03067 domain-containing protein [Planctomycetes bacterium]|nr:TIGR03067 domain-containing protein [Planctomycetota bacterium]